MFVHEARSAHDYPFDDDYERVQDRTYVARVGAGIPSLIEEYVRARVRLHFHVRVCAAGDSADFCTVLEWPWSDRPDLCGWRSRLEADRPDQLCLRYEQMDRAVLVDVPEYFQQVDRNGVSVLPTVARLMLRNQSDARWAQPYQLAGPAAATCQMAAKLTLLGTDRETRVSAGNSAVVLDKDADKMIEARAQIVNDLSDNDAPKHFKLGSVEAPDVFPGFRVTLTRHGALVEPKGSGYGIEQLVFLLARPLEPDEHGE